ncbi:hypothetical protein WA538_002295 [Blastocystis sp. DL]
MKLVRTHKLFDSSVFAADFRLLRDQSGQYLLDHTSGRCDHFTCSEIPIMQALMSSKSCLIVAESRGIGELLNFCVAGVFVHSDDAIGTKRFGVSEQYGNRYIPLMEYQKTSKSYSFSYDRLLTTIVGDGAAAQPFSLSLCYNAYPTFIEYYAFTQAMSLLKDDQIVVLRGVNLAKNRGLLEGVLRLGLQVT